MTQRVARPMKFAAFISIIVSLAVIIGACQGAVGKPGKDAVAVTGPTGPSGPSGLSGDPGFTALQSKGPAPYEYINDGEDEEGDATPGEAVTVNLGDYYRGSLDTTVEISTPLAEASPLTATLDAMAKTLTLAVRMTDAEPPVPEVTGEPAYAPQMVTVTVTDTEGSTLDLVVSTRRNRPPETDTIDAITIGTEDSKRDASRTDGDASCAKQNECVLTIAYGTQQGSAPFTDLDGEDDELTYVPTTESDAVEIVKVEGNMITIKGVTATDDGDDATADDSAKVKITVTDKGGLMAELTLSVTVDGAPMADGVIPDISVSQQVLAYERLVGDLKQFFKDETASADLVYTVEVEDEQVATAVVDDSDDSLDVTTIATGTTMVTVTATEPSGQDSLQQKGTQTFSLTVTARQ
jgi:hypothetical protein